jgi:hypothetical protein
MFLSGKDKSAEKGTRQREKSFNTKWEEPRIEKRESFKKR